MSKPADTPWSDLAMVGNTISSRFPPRIAVMIFDLSGGGSSRTAITLASALAKTAARVDLVVVRAKGPLRTEIGREVRLVELGASRLLASIPALVRYLKRERPDVLLSVTDQVNVVAVWARLLARVPMRLVISERNTLSQKAARAPTLIKRLMPRLVRRFYPWADQIVAVSEGVADDIAAITGIARSRIAVIYNPVVTPRLQRSAAQPLDHSWFVHEAPPVILAVGRLHPQKDFPTLIRAFARVRERRRARLLILGEGDERPALEALSQSLGMADDVAMPGFVDNPFAYMARAGVFVLPSAFEGLPGVLIQAMACGCPVVSTDCPSGPREVLENGRHGPLVPVGDDVSLAAAIEAVLERPHPADQLRGRAAFFALDQAVDRHLDLLLGGLPSGQLHEPSSWSDHVYADS
jgi:glycosyltransferase involved in cell wall biosynthesis